ncbi:MAG: RNA-binding S4 domain-containing protein [Bacillales bacterium]|jgi:ribosomal 50S subunit-recycling heat shock protein|nr:RNA-binding S4 domain-containing protein [Bacillales bacterium]
MRLDKFLKVSRIILRRSVANKLADHNLVYVNDKQVKPSYIVKIGDVIKVVLGTHYKIYEVVDIKEFANKENASKLIKEIEIK